MSHVQYRQAELASLYAGFDIIHSKLVISNPTFNPAFFVPQRAILGRLISDRCSTLNNVILNQYDDIFKWYDSYNSACFHRSPVLKEH